MSRFEKGRSGNPAGRPRKKPVPVVSAFEVILDRTFTQTQNGKVRELSVDEALQLKTYQDALAGNRAARREVLKMIAKREAWLAQRKPPMRPITLAMELDPDNAVEALVILGIATPDTRDFGSNDKYKRHKLEPWAVKAALARKAGRRLTRRDLNEMQFCVRDWKTIAWPRPIDE